MVILLLTTRKTELGLQQTTKDLEKPEIIKKELKSNMSQFHVLKELILNKTAK
jgi:hypothetical protein